MIKTMPEELIFSRSISYNVKQIINDIIEMADDESIKPEDITLEQVVDWINDTVWEDLSKLYEKTRLRIEDEDGQYIGELG
jgi:hypothetical protein